MIEQLPFLLWPFLGLLAIASLHVYLGLHVVERGVIFVDLALAQVAVLGTAVASVAGMEPGEPGTYALSLGFTVLGALAFSITRSERGRIPQEAIIGIVYAVAAAATVLILNNSPHGAEHIKDVLIGQLLAVGPADVLRLVVLYAVLGLLHYLWRKPLLLISQHPEAACAAGLRVRLWDFLFYVTFGLTVTASVALGGVLVVFSYLIVPSVAALLFTESLRARLMFGWTLALVVSALGMIASVAWGAPPGASVVCVYGAALLVLALVRGMMRSRRLAAT